MESTLGEYRSGSLEAEMEGLRAQLTRREAVMSRVDAEIDQLKLAFAQRETVRDA